MFKVVLAFDEKKKEGRTSKQFAGNLLFRNIFLRKVEKPWEGDEVARIIIIFS